MRMKPRIDYVSRQGHDEERAEKEEYASLDMSLESGERMVECAMAV